MKNFIKITVLCTSVIVFSGFDSVNIKTKQIESISLERAIKDKLITVFFISTGNYNGNSIKCSFKNLKSSVLKIIVPAGSYFKAPDTKEQDLIIPQDQLVALNANQSKSFVLNGYCTNLSKKVPKREGKFTLVASKAPKEMSKLLALLKDKKFENCTIQNAIWTITNKISVSNLHGGDQQDMNDLMKGLCLITGQNESWYSSPQVIDVLADGTINRETVSINGEIVYLTTKNAKVHTEVVGFDGLVKIKSESKSTAFTGELNYFFKVEVKGWKRGSYKVNVVENAKIIKSYDFVV